MTEESCPEYEVTHCGADRILKMTPCKIPISSLFTQTPIWYFWEEILQV